MADASGLREHQRFGTNSEVFLSWTDSQGVNRQAKGKCVDLSERGLGVLLDVEIPVRSYVGIRLSGRGFSGSGSVRSVKREGLRLLTGIEFSGALRIPQSLIDEHTVRK